MNIAIDVSATQSAHAKRGVGIYTKNLVEALKRDKSGHSYTFFTRKQKVPDMVDVVHYPYFDPFFLTLPLNKPKPTVVTCHDLTPLVFPDKFPRGLRGSIKWQVQRMSLRGAARIIADSKTSKKDIARIAGISSGRIDVVYLAPAIKPVSGVNAKYPKHYVLYVGDVNWNKNIPGLIRAIGKRALVVVGSAFVNDNLPETRELNELIKETKANVIRTGYVSNTELAQLYGAADCLVMPSFYEGFGLPVLEAMTCGCPVVAADNSSLSEITGPAVRVTTDPASIKEGIRKAIQGRTALVTKGYEWVANFSWDKVARETVASYEKAVNYHSGI